MIAKDRLFRMRKSLITLAKIVTVLLLTVLVISLSYLAFVHVRNTCSLASSISSEKDAIVAAKRLLNERATLYFEGIGNIRDFIRSIEGNVNCCRAVRQYSLLYLSNVWSVDLVSPKDSWPKYHVIVDVTQCGEAINIGKLAL